MVLTEKTVLDDLKNLYKKQVKGTYEEIGEHNRHLQEIEDQLFVGFASYILANAGYNDTTLYNTSIGDDQVFEVETTKDRLVDWVDHIRYHMAVKEEENVLEQLGGDIFADYPRYLTWSHCYEQNETKERLKIIFTQNTDVTTLFNLSNKNWKVLRGIDQTRKNIVLINPVIKINKPLRELRNKLSEESVFLMTVQDLTNQFITRSEQARVVNDWISVRDRVLRELESYEPLVAEAIDPRNLTLEELIKLPESNRLEFKSSITFDTKHGNYNRERIDDVTKALSALMNTDGGVLVLGVSDNPRVVLGLERDVKKIGNETNEDALERCLTEIIVNYLGIVNQKYFHPKFKQIDGKIIAKIDIDPAESEVYCTDTKGKKHFFVRAQNTSRSLEAMDAIEYSKDHWKRKRR
jgi:nicotinamide riboside kinase